MKRYGLLWNKLVVVVKPSLNGFQLIDAMGRIVRTLEFDGNNTQHEINEISNGIYNLSIQYADGTTESKRIVTK